MSKLPFNSENQEALLQVTNILVLSTGEYKYKRVTVKDHDDKQYSFDVNVFDIQDYLLSRGCSSVTEAADMAKHLWNDAQVIQNYANHIGINMMMELKGVLS